jgi:hypothetical protein
MALKDIPQWVPITEETPKPGVEVHLAMVLNGVIQQLISVPLSTAALILSNPEFVQVPTGSQPGMLIQEALEIVEPE